MARDAEARGADGVLGSAAGCHPREAIPAPRKTILGLRLYGTPHLRPRPELENIRPLLPGRHSSPEETSPLDTSRDTPQDSLIFLAVGWTDRQTDIRLPAVWLLVEGHEKWKCICCD